MLNISDEERMQYIAAGTLFITIFVICYVINIASSRLRLPFFIRTSFLCFGGGALFQTSILHLLINAQYRLPNASLLILCSIFILSCCVDQVLYFSHNIHGVLYKIVNIFQCPNEPSYIPDYDHSSFYASTDSRSSGGSGNSDDEERAVLPLGNPERAELMKRVLHKERYPTPCKSSEPLIGTHTKYGSLGYAETKTHSCRIGIVDPQPGTSQDLKGCVKSNSKLSSSKSTPSFNVSPPPDPNQKRRKISEYNRPTMYDEIPCTSGFSSVLIYPSDMLEPAFAQKRPVQDEYNEVPGNDIACHTNYQLPILNQSRAGLLTVFVAICIHSVLEGISIGLESTNEKVLFLSRATDCSRLMLAACLTMELKNKDAGKCSFFTHILVYSIISAMGNISGMMIKKYEISMDSHIVPVFQAVAAGLLLFAVFVIVNREKVKLQVKQASFCAAMFQVCSFGIGFAVMHLIDIFIVPGLPDLPDLTVIER